MLRPKKKKKKKICVFQVSALKKLSMVGRHYILFCQNILYRNYIFDCIFHYFCSIFDNILLTIHNRKCLGWDKNLSRVGKHETHIYMFLPYEVFSASALEKQMIRPNAGIYY